MDESVSLSVCIIPGSGRGGILLFILSNETAVWTSMGSTSKVLRRLERFAGLGPVHGGSPGINRPTGPAIPRASGENQQPATCGQTDGATSWSHP